MTSPIHGLGFQGFVVRYAIFLWLISCCTDQLETSTASDDFTTMFTQGLVYVLNSGQSIQLDCEFAVRNFSHFHNPVVWRKFQREEQTQLNVLSTILPPFVHVDRFNVSFVVVRPPRYRLTLSISDLSPEDSGNYTCEVRGRGSVIRATVTHYIFVRASVQRVSLRLGNVTYSTPTSTNVDEFDDWRQPQRVQRSATFVDSQSTVVECGSVGGYPPPDTSIRLGSLDITDAFELSYTATLRGDKGLRLMVYETRRRCRDCVMTSSDDGKTLMCVVTVPGMASIVTTTTIVVLYAPIADCRPTVAQPGERNVHLDCTVRSRPPLSALFWVVDGNGTTVSDGEVVSEYWTLVKDIGDGAVECQLYMRRAESINFRLYTLVAENNIAVTTHRVPLVNSQPTTRLPTRVAAAPPPTTRPVVAAAGQQPSYYNSRTESVPASQYRIIDSFRQIASGADGLRVRKRIVVACGITSAAAWIIASLYFCIPLTLDVIIGSLV